MDARVICNLNIRSNPSVNAINHGYLKPGDLLRIDDVVEGEYYEGNNLWFKGNDGCFYWSGGVDYSSILTKPINWNNELAKMPPEWRQFRGKGVKVAVLDTGIIKCHPDLYRRLSVQRCNDCSGEGNINDNDDESHGTHCCGLIGAESLGRNGITGIAPECELYIGKVIHPEFGATEKRIAAGIEWAIGQGVNVINLSLGDFEQGKKNSVKRAVEKAIGKGILLVCAAGENEMLFDSFYFPAMFDGCISVGAVSRQFLSAMSGSRFHKRLDYLVSLEALWSCSSIRNGLYKAMSGSSMACAVV
jgi:subtilisin family serine protease